jgi:hypothetical protein
LDRVTARLELDKSIPQAGPSVVIQTRRALYIGRIEVSVPVVDHAKVGQPQFQEPGASAGENGASISRAWLTRAPVLVLNLNYVPVNVCTVRRTIILLVKGKAEHLENHPGQLRTVSAVIDAPSIIRLAYQVKRPFLPRKLSKKRYSLETGILANTVTRRLRT